MSKNRNKTPAITQFRAYLEERKEKKKETILFNDKVKSYTDNKAPETLRTKSYYRYAKKYPAVVDTEGFRENEKQIPAGKSLRVTITALVCILVFLCSMFLTKTAVILSKMTPENNNSDVIISEDLYMMRIENGLSESELDSVLDSMITCGVNCVVVEIKKPDGTIPYEPDGKKLATLLDTIAAKHLFSAAFISCYRDTAHAFENTDQAVMKETDGERSLLYNSDGFAYLNPFSDEATEYINDIIRKTAEAGFTYIILDDITLPVNTGNSVPVYPGYDGQVNELNAILKKRLNFFLKTAGAEKVILATDVYGFYETDSVTGTRYEGTLSSVSCYNRAVDVRISTQNTEGKDPLAIMPYIANLPSVFILEASSQAAAATSDSIKLFAICDSEEDAEYAEASGIKNLIIMK